MASDDAEEVDQLLTDLLKESEAGELPQDAHLLEPTTSLRRQALAPVRRKSLVQLGTPAIYGRQSPMGEGAHGKAYTVRDTLDKQDYILKVVPIAEDFDSVALEARIHAKLNHASVVKYVFAWAEGGMFNMLLENCGVELWECLPATDKRHLRMEWAKQIVEGMMHIHSRGVIHRDLNPWNVFINSANHAKIGDFGLSTEAKPGGDTHTGLASPGACPLDVSAIGSLYSAPELGSETPGYDCSADIYSLGTLLFAVFLDCKTQDDMITEVEKFSESRRQGGSLPACLSSMPADVRSVIVKCTKLDPRQRPSAATIAKGLGLTEEDKSPKSVDKSHSTKSDLADKVAPKPECTISESKSAKSDAAQRKLDPPTDIVTPGVSVPGTQSSNCCVVQ